VDLTVFTVLGPYQHILKMPFITHLTKWLTTAFHFLATTQSPRIPIHQQDTRHSPWNQSWWI
jgi:hypothetical protein